MRFRRPLLIAAVVLVSVLIIAVVVSASSKRTDAFQATCNQFIGYLIQKNSKASYAMFSDDAKALDTQNTWNDKVIGLFGAYNLGQATYVTQTDTTAQLTTGSGATQPTHKDLAYTLTNPVATSDISCKTVQQDGTIYIDGYSSTIRTEDAQ